MKQDNDIINKIKTMRSELNRNIKMTPWELYVTILYICMYIYIGMMSLSNANIILILQITLIIYLFNLKIKKN